MPDRLSKATRADVTALRKKLGLEAWRIEIKFTDKPGGVVKEGQAELKPRYLVANIEINSAMDDYGTRDILLHEHLHVAFAQMDMAVDRILDLVPKKRRKHAEAIYTDAQEQTIVRLVDGLLDTLLPSREKT